MAVDADLAVRLRDILSGEPGLREQRMFGGLAFLIYGHMAVAASGQGGLLLRVDPGRTDALLRSKHAQSFVMRGRPMQGWLRVDTAGIRTTRQLAAWARIGVDYARSLPPKR